MPYDKNIVKVTNRQKLYLPGLDSNCCVQEDKRDCCVQEIRKECCVQEIKRDCCVQNIKNDCCTQDHYYNQSAPIVPRYCEEFVFKEYRFPLAASNSFCLQMQERGCDVDFFNVILISNTAIPPGILLGSGITLEFLFSGKPKNGHKFFVTVSSEFIDISKTPPPPPTTILFENSNNAQQAVYSILTCNKNILSTNLISISQLTVPQITKGISNLGMGWQYINGEFFLISTSELNQ